MFTTRSKTRASALLAATALAGSLTGAAAPAFASGGSHTVNVRVGSTLQGWATSLSCKPTAGGAAFTRALPAATVWNLLSLSVYQLASFKDVPNATCDVSAVSTGLLNGGSAVQSGVAVSKDLTVMLTPGTASTATVPVAVPVTTSPVTTTPTVAPVITGQAAVGHTLVASPALAPADASVTGYQWYVKRVVSGHARSSRTILVRIKGAHHQRLRLKERLAGEHVLVGVTYTKAGSAPATAYSHPVKIRGHRLKEGH